MVLASYLVDEIVGPTHVIFQWHHIFNNMAYSFYRNWLAHIQMCFFLPYYVFSCHSIGLSHFFFVVVYCLILLLSAYLCFYSGFWFYSFDDIIQSGRRWRQKEIKSSDFIDFLFFSVHSVASSSSSSSVHLYLFFFLVCSLTCIYVFLTLHSISLSIHCYFDTYNDIRKCIFEQFNTNLNHLNFSGEKRIFFFIFCVLKLYYPFFNWKLHLCMIFQKNVMCNKIYYWICMTQFNEKKT